MDRDGYRITRSGQSGAHAIGEESTAPWWSYLMWVAVAVVVIWCLLFVLLRTNVVEPGDWFYENTYSIPFLGKESYARKNK